MERLCFMHRHEAASGGSLCHPQISGAIRTPAQQLAYPAKSNVPESRIK